MTESLIAFCVVLLIAAGVIVAFAIAVECLRRLTCRRSPAPAGSDWTPSSTTRDRPETRVARRRHMARAGLQSRLAEHIARSKPQGAGTASVRRRPRFSPLSGSLSRSRSSSAGAESGTGTEMDRAPLLAFLRMFPQPR
jgi:hypothetical protein